MPGPSVILEIIESDLMTTPLLENILNQPAALRAVGAHHIGAGRDSLERASALFRSSKRVVLSGMGASFFACIPFSYRLSLRGCCVIAVETSELLHFLEPQIDRDTVVVLVSRSGESVEVTMLLQRLQERKATVIGVVNVPESTLSTKANQAIVMGSPPDQLVAIQTYTATLATFVLLDAAIAGQLDVATAELEKTANVLSRWIPECVAARETWSGFLGSSAPLYLLGRGPASGSVAEGVLLMHEVAKSSAVGMTVAQFRHGPVEVVNGNFRAVIFGTQRQTAALDAALANDLVGMGARVRWIGPDAPGTDTIPLCPWPSGLPERFIPIAEIIPLQLAAYKKAELLGIRPGDFRWAPAITTSEAGFPVRDGQ
jgi:glucosamine--fructose-6-phosphate aminotransferase (isomerizing)